MTIAIDPQTRIAELEAENAELKMRLAEFERKVQAVPLIAVKAIEFLNNEIAGFFVHLGSSLIDAQEKRATEKDIKFDLAAISVLANMRGEAVNIGGRWRIPSEKGDQFYITWWDVVSDLGSCNCGAGVNGKPCKHVEAARALTLVSEVQ